MILTEIEKIDKHIARIERDVFSSEKTRWKLRSRFYKIVQLHKTH